VSVGDRLFEPIESFVGTAGQNVTLKMLAIAESLRGSVQKNLYSKQQFSFSHIYL
jgi:hypothetical protein